MLKEWLKDKYRYIIISRYPRTYIVRKDRLYFATGQKTLSDVGSLAALIAYDKPRLFCEHCLREVNPKDHINLDGHIYCEDTCACSECLYNGSCEIIRCANGESWRHESDDI